MTEATVETLVESGCLLGEGPVWRPETETLYWTDIEGRRLWRWSADIGPSSVPVIASAGGLVLGPRETLVAPMDRGFAMVEANTGAARAIGNPLASPAGTLMNDGKCDRRGRLICGSKHLAESAGEGVAFVLDRGQSRVLMEGFVVFNGPAFSPGGECIYYADSPTKRIMTAAYDIDRGGIVGKPEVFAELGAEEGYPDGMTVDGEGGLWNARWDGWALARYRPDGMLDRVVDLPVPRPTSVAFGGAGMETLFVTSARTRLDEGTLKSAPLSGSVFTVRTGCRGIAETIYQD